MTRSNGSDFFAPVRVAVLAVAVLGWAWLIWDVSANYHQRSSQTNVQARHEMQNTTTRVQQACLGKQGSSFLDCVVEQVTAAREAERAEYDLQAQQDMANWAFWMFVVSSVTTIITAMALWFVKGTLEATREAVREAAEGTRAALVAAEAGRDANRIASEENARAASRALAAARDTSDAIRAARRSANAMAKLSKVSAEHGERELRAYIDFENVSVVRAERKDTESNVGLEVRVYVKNFGKTPAEDVHVKLSYDITDKTGKVLRPLVRRDRKGIGSIMPDDHLIFSDVFSIIKAERDRMLALENFVNSSISISFTDAFKKVRTLESVYRSYADDTEMGFIAGTRRTD